MEEEVLGGAQKGGCCGCFFPYVVHDGGKIKQLHPVQVPARTRIQTAQHGTVDVHAIVPGGVIRVIDVMGVRATRKYDECHYQKEWKECCFFHQGDFTGNEIG